ncbi:MAG: hypothetical protein QOI38_1938 [Sphingomonadales bacterium]|jgi:hypothetical protein|nr:hypothetical protein [Sphingomonadales bacterium]
MAADPRRNRILAPAGAAALLAAALAALMAVRAGDEASCRAFSGPRTEVWLVLGQSNAASHAQARTRAGPAVAAFDGRRCVAARDPLPGGTGAGGSLWPALADAWARRGGAGRILVAMVAQESTPVARWQPGGRLHRRALRTIEALRDRGLPVDRIFWIQGETDAILGTGEADYAQGLRSALAPLHRASGAPVWIALASRCGDAVSPGVRAAQAAAPARHGWARAGPDLDRIGGDGRYERCHFARPGQARAVRLWLDVLAGATAI